MPEINVPIPATVAAILAHYVRTQSPRRPHLGASEIGDPCDRKLWYGFRWAVPRISDGRLLRLFDRGNREEPRLFAELRSIGVRVLERDEGTGKQWAFSAHGGHFGGSLDAVALGILEAPRTWHVVECKTASDRSWRKLEREGVATAQPKHFAQMQSYMLELGLERAAYFSTNKDREDLYFERVEIKKADGERNRARALRVITAPEPLEKIADDPGKYPCSWCDARPVCHGTDLPAPTCRTCCHATPEIDGEERWSCAKHKKDLSRLAQEVGCEHHLYIPALLASRGRPVDADPEAGAVVYERPDGSRFANATVSGFGSAPSYTSRELHLAPAEAVGHPGVEVAREVLGAKVIAP